MQRTNNYDFHHRKNENVTYTLVVADLSLILVHFQAVGEYLLVRMPLNTGQVWRVGRKVDSHVPLSLPLTPRTSQLPGIHKEYIVYLRT